MCVTLAPSWAQGLQSLLSSTITYFHLQPLGEREVVEPRGQEPRLWSHWDTSSSPHSHFFSCCCSVAKSHLSLCDPMSCSMSGFSVLHYLLEFAQIHFHWVSDAIQSSHPLPSPSPIFSLSLHQGLFQWVIGREKRLQVRSYEGHFYLKSCTYLCITISAQIADTCLKESREWII